METKVEKLKESRIKLTVNVPAAEMVKHFKSAYAQLGPSVKLAGFRPGKAPRKLIEESLGISKILSHALDAALQENYSLALNKEEIYPIAQPNVVINKYPTYGLTEEEISDGFEFEAEVEVFPQPQLGDYSKIKVDAGKPEEVKDEDTKKILEHLRKQKATFTEIECPAQKGNFAEIDFEGTQKGVRIDQMSSKNHPLVIGEGGLIPGFEEELIGLKKGEEKTFQIKFPKDYHSGQFAGQEAEFKVKLHQLKEVKLPELDDNFARKFGHKNIDELKTAIRDNLKKELEHKYKHDLEEKVVERVLPLLKVEVPEVLVNQEIQRMTKGMQDQVASQGLNFEAYLNSIKKTTEDLKKDFRLQAEKNVRTGILLGQVIRDQKMDEKDPEAGRKALDFLVEELTKK